jgi:hypothetical protein
VVQVELYVSSYSRAIVVYLRTYSSLRIIHDSSLLEIRKDHFRDVSRRTQERPEEYMSTLATTLLLLLRIDIQ